MAMAKPLSLGIPLTGSPMSSAITSSAGSRSHSPSNHSLTLLQDESPCLNNENNSPTSPSITSLPQHPASPMGSIQAPRKQTKSLFTNSKASKSSDKLQNTHTSIRQVTDDQSTSNGDHQEIYNMRSATGSTPDLSRITYDESESQQNTQQNYENGIRRPVGLSMLSDSVVLDKPEETQIKKTKPRFAQFLNRTMSTRTEQGGRRSKPPTPVQTNIPENPTGRNQAAAPEDLTGFRTAPLQQPDRDRSLREMMSSSIRNRSVDRQPPSLHSTDATMSRSTKDHLLSNIKTKSNKAADGLGKASKFLGKITRSGSSNEREKVDDEPYVFKVINKPLVEQTRITRIAKRLEHSKDKTEFWMPALPWRCIDYLNFRGCEEEGLYRIPGASHQIKEWQQRFDREYDINLFDQPELYDINIIGSMFKAWLRDLPTEILPKGIQARVSEHCAGATEVPQLLKDELSSLPPWNYYLLFAITCHLSLLHAYVDKNKMNYSNLCICFQPCLRIDSFCFQFLVCDWRNCWQGCWTEKDALGEEYRSIAREGMHSSGGESSGGSTAVAEERSIASRQSEKKAIVFGRRGDIRAQSREGRGESREGRDRSRPSQLSVTTHQDEPPDAQEADEQEPRVHSTPRELPQFTPLSPIAFGRGSET